MKPIPLWVLIVTVPASLFLGSVLSWLAFAPDDNESSVRSGELREQSGQFTNPLLECEVFGDQGLKTLKPFKYKVEALLQQKIDDGVLMEGTVYFRDLNNGLWFGINEDAAYHPASLLKVPIMIAYFKLAEKNPALLGKKILFQGNFDITQLQGIIPSSELVPGMSYTVEDLIVRMITLSDNNAAQLLVNNIDRRELDKVLTDIDVNVNPEDHEHLITTHAYSGFFRVLYNASYLNREFSEKALEILSRSEFTSGLRAGLPPGQLAATKFGEWGYGPNKEIVQLHEFGIVYYPGRPYLLGIMTRGRRGGDFSAVIKDISRLVYDSVDQQHAQSVPTSPPMFR